MGDVLNFKAKNNDYDDIKDLAIAIAEFRKCVTYGDLWSAGTTAFAASFSLMEPAIREVDKKEKQRIFKGIRKNMNVVLDEIENKIIRGLI